MQAKKTNCQFPGSCVIILIFGTIPQGFLIVNDTVAKRKAQSAQRLGQ